MEYVYPKTILLVTITPGSVNGKVQAHPSKSCTQRAYAAALLKQGSSTIINPGTSNDELASLDIIQHLGAQVVTALDHVIISSDGIHPIQKIIECGESGLSARMFTPIAALSPEAITLNGSGSLLDRPFSFFDEVLPKVAVKVRSNNGKLPLSIQGPLHAKDIVIDSSLSSQYLTGLLLAYSSLDIKEPVIITVNRLTSKPYIDLTLDVIKHLGLNTPINDGYTRFTFHPFSPTPHPVTYTVEGDWSGAAFLLVAGAIAGSVSITGLRTNSYQPDKAIVEVLRSAGANVTISDHSVTAQQSPLRSFSFDATDCPDLFPPLAALASCCNGTSSIKGVHRLKHKESDRALALQQEFARMNIHISVEDDNMLISGSGNINGATVHSHHDHRIAMACAVPGLRANSTVTITDAQAVNKSYPTFFLDLESLGTKVAVY